MGPTPPPDAPTISCPANQSTRTTGSNATITYPPPTVTGGEAPVPVACTPPSGSAFPAGMSTTTCVATDARQRSAMCTFTVTVEVVPVLSVTHFVAFGDSITEGILASGDLAANPYPAELKRQLTSRYSTQEFVVQNRGVGGERTTDGVRRFPGVLGADNPEVVLLFEGVNDLAQGDQSQISVVIGNLRTMIQQAQGRGIRVFLGTLLPEIPGGSRTEIRMLAATQGATLVDLYQAFAGMERALIGVDGLHPNEMGYQKIGETFFNAVRTRLETAPTLTWTRFDQVHASR